MVEIQDGRYSSGLYKKWYAPICLDVACTYTTQRKHCYVRLRGCPYAPYIWMPSYVWMPCCMLGCPSYVWIPPVCLDGLLYVWMLPICLPVCLDTPICLDAPVCLGTPYVWDAPGCLDTPIDLDALCTYTIWRKHALSH